MNQVGADDVLAALKGCVACIHLNAEPAGLTESEQLAVNAAETAIAKAEAEAAALSVEREWQPIETAPRDGSRVLAWHSEWSASLTVQFYGEWWGIHHSVPRLFNQPTHWQPLPAPPHRAGDDT